MIIRLYESGKLDLETVGEMLWQADKQANFHPDARWINSSSFGTTEASTRNKSRVYREFSVRWIGRESVVMWLTSNQILFEVMSFDMLPEEEEAINETYSNTDFTEPLNHIN
jgi:hypothetical protein